MQNVTRESSELLANRRQPLTCTCKAINERTVAGFQSPFLYRCLQRAFLVTRPREVVKFIGPGRTTQATSFRVDNPGFPPPTFAAMWLTT